MSHVSFSPAATGHLLRNPIPTMDMSRQRGLPPKLGIKKRKPRASAVIDTANGHPAVSGRKDATAAAAATAATPARPAQPHLGRAQQAKAAAARKAAVAAVAAVAAPGTSAAAFPAPGSGRNGGGAAVSAEEYVKRKGLRHFAVRVSKKVEEKNITTYNEVADELVVEEKEIKQQEVEGGGKAAIALKKKLEKTGSLVDEKNIRRRVYDSLNVLMAMGIIEKDKKLISWRGLAMARGGGGHREAVAMRHGIEEQRRVLAEKRALFTELEDQATTLAALIRRNAQATRDEAGGEGEGEGEVDGEGKGDGRRGTGEVAAGGPPYSGSENGGNGVKARTEVSKMVDVGGDRSAGLHGNAQDDGSASGSKASAGTAAGGISRGEPDKIPIPFIVVAAGESSQIELEMDHLREDITFTFSSAFAVFDDREVLRRMNLTSSA